MMLFISIMQFLCMITILVICPAFLIHFYQKHYYNTRLASKSSFSLPQIRTFTNYGKFNIIFNGPKLWNSIEKKAKALGKSMVKKKLKYCLLES